MAEVVRYVANNGSVKDVMSIIKEIMAEPRCKMPVDEAVYGPYSKLLLGEMIRKSNLDGNMDVSRCILLFHVVFLYSYGLPRVNFK
jgi:hypothetical protein